MPSYETPSLLTFALTECFKGNIFSEEFTIVINDVKQQLDRYCLTKLVGEEQVHGSFPDVFDTYRKETKQIEDGPEN